MSSQAVAHMFAIASILGNSLSSEAGRSQQQNCVQRACLMDRSCPPSLLERIPLLCGPTDNEHCFSKHQSECRESLVRLKSAPELQSSCYCQNPSSRSCQDYYNLLYNHPCLRQGPVIYPQSLQPYNFDLEFAGQLLMTKHVLLSCTSALHACRKSPLCRRVYDEFRRRCKIKDNRCRMTNAALCYNSYELIKLTPLWRCTCDRPSEKRCFRIQKSIVGNPCIGGIPSLYDVDGPDDGNFSHLATPATATRRPIAFRTTTTRRTTTRHRVSPAQAHQVAATTTRSEPDHGDGEGEDTEAPNTDGEGPTESPDTSDSGDDNLPPLDVEYDLVPHIFAAAMYPLALKIKSILLEDGGMMTEPTARPVAVTKAPTTKLVPGSDSGEPDAATGGPGHREPMDEDSRQNRVEFSNKAAANAFVALAQGSASTIGPNTTMSSSTMGTRMVTQPGPVRRRNTTTAGPRVSSTTSRVSSTTTGRSVGITRTSAPTVTSSVSQPVTVSTPAEEDVSSSSPDDDLEPDYQITGDLVSTPDPDQLPPETTTEVFIDYSIPDLRILPSGMCWRQIDVWRENAEFNMAIEDFHASCRWSTSANESCDATRCLDAEARLQHWMGDMFPYCRNLSCENSVPECDELLQFLSPGCVRDAFFLEDMETETVTCRDFKRNGLVLTVPRNTYKRVFQSDFCSEFCTCTADGKVECTTLPCMESEKCQGNYATYPAGSPSFKAYRGLCVCYMSKMICVRPFNFTTSRGVWLFMGYSAEEEDILTPITNLTIDNDIIARMRRLPYPMKREEPCLFHLEPSEPNLVVLRSDEFEFDNSTELYGSPGTRLNEEYCDKFFRWIANEVTEKRSARQDLLMSLIKLAEVEWNKRPVPNTASNIVLRTAPLLCTLFSLTVSLLFRDITFAFNKLV